LSSLFTSCSGNGVWLPFDATAWTYALNRSGAIPQVM
jgi:hypothetical protein